MDARGTLYTLSYMPRCHTQRGGSGDGTPLVQLGRAAPPRVARLRNPQRDLPTLKDFVRQHAHVIISFIRASTRTRLIRTVYSRCLCRLCRAQGSTARSRLCHASSRRLRDPRGWRVVARDAPRASTGPELPTGPRARYDYRSRPEPRTSGRPFRLRPLSARVERL